MLSRFICRAPRFSSLMARIASKKRSIFVPPLWLNVSWSAPPITDQSRMERDRVGSSDYARGPPPSDRDHNSGHASKNRARNGQSSKGINSSCALTPPSAPIAMMGGGVAGRGGGLHVLHFSLQLPPPPILTSRPLSDLVGSTMDSLDLSIAECRCGTDNKPARVFYGGTAPQEGGGVVLYKLLGDEASLVNIRRCFVENPRRAAVSFDSGRTYQNYRVGGAPLQLSSYAQHGRALVNHLLSSTFSVFFSWNERAVSTTAALALLASGTVGGDDAVPADLLSPQLSARWWFPEALLLHLRLYKSEEDEHPCNPEDWLGVHRRAKAIVNESIAALSASSSGSHRVQIASVRIITAAVKPDRKFQVAVLFSPSAEARHIKNVRDTVNFFASRLRPTAATDADLSCCVAELSAELTDVDSLFGSEEALLSVAAAQCEKALKRCYKAGEKKVCRKRQAPASGDPPTLLAHALWLHRTHYRALAAPRR